MEERGMRDLATFEGDRFTSLDYQVQSRLSTLFATGLCEPNSIDDRAVEHLAGLRPQQAMQALDKFEAGLSKSEVRNHSAYLQSVIKRMVNPTGPSLQELAPQAQQVLAQLYESGHIQRTDLDMKCLHILASHPPEFQVLALDTFAERNLTGVRNMAAYFTTHLIRTEEQVRSGQLELPIIDAPLIAPQLQQQQLLLQQQQQQMLQQQRLLMAGGMVPPGAIVIPAGMGAAAGIGSGFQAPGIAKAGTTVQQVQSLGAAPAPKHYGVEQAEWGVRIDEFHGLSPLAKYVHQAAALKLQELWDTGNKLVSLLDDNSWEALAGLDANHAVAAVGEAANATMLMAEDIPSVNALFVQAAAKFPKRANAPSAANILGSGRGIGPSGLGGQFEHQLQQQQQQQPQEQAGLPGSVMLQPQASGAALGGMMVLQQQPGGSAMLQMPAGGPMLGGMPGGLVGFRAQAPLLMQQQGQAQQGMQLAGPAGMLPMSLQQRIASIVGGSGGMVRLENFDAKVVSAMQRLGEFDSISVLEEFGRNDFSGIRNVPAFIMGILKKYAAASVDFDGHSSGGGWKQGDRDAGAYEEESAGYMNGGMGRGGRHGAGRGGPRGNFGRRYEPY